MVIRVRGINTTKEHLARFKESMRDMTAAMGSIGETLAHYYSNEPFISRGSVYGKTWTPLATSTQTEKSRKYPGRGPLVRTGTMQNSFGYEVTPLSVTVKNAVEVNGYNLLTLQQEGTSRGIPPRTVMALNETLRQEVEIIAQEAVYNKLEATRI